MTSLRTDGWRDRLARRRPASATPTRIILVLSALVACLAVTAGLTALGVPAWIAAAGVLAVATVALTTARRTTARLLAGLVLLTVRPYRPGEQVRLWSPTDGAVVDVELVRIGLLHSVLHTTAGDSAGLLTVPNTRLLRPAPVLS